MEYKIDLGIWNGVFAVPCDIVDKHLRLAGAAQLKVLLYILRHSGRDISIDLLARETALSKGDAEDALHYWDDAGLVRIEAGSIAPVSGPDDTTIAQVAPDAKATDAAEGAPDLSEKPAVPSAPEAVAANAPVAEKAKPPVKAKPRFRYSFDECASMLADDPELQQLMGILEVLLAKQLNHSELTVFITLVKWYGLSPSCVALLVEYCGRVGKGSIAYIESVGTGWAEEGITDLDAANAKVERLLASRSAWTKVRGLLGVPERAPSKKEDEFCCRWLIDWRLEPELISLAYERCVDKKGKLSFSYMNGILDNWQKSGVTTVDEANSEQKPQINDSAKKPNGRFAATYDKDDIDSILDDDWLEDS